MAACGTADKATGIMVVVDSDIPRINRIQVRVRDRQGVDESRMRELRIGDSPSAGVHSFPLTFGLTPEDVGDTKSFRLLVTGLTHAYCGAGVVSVALFLEVYEATTGFTPNSIGERLCTSTRTP